MWNCKRSQVVTTVLSKNSNVGGITIPEDTKHNYTYLCLSGIWQICQIATGEETVFSTSANENMECPHTAEEMSIIQHKIWCLVGHVPQCEIWNAERTRRKIGSVLHYVRL